jgi:hypothetical protein
MKAIMGAVLVAVLVALPVYAGPGGARGSGGRGGGHSASGMSSGRGYSSGRSGYRYDGQRWRRGAPSWGVGSGVGTGIDPDTMDAVNARIRQLKRAAAEKATAIRDAARIQARRH